MAKSAYAAAGVDYTIMEPFKQAMVACGKHTLSYPNRRGVFISGEAAGTHGAVYEYRGSLPHLWCKTQEDLGNKNWIAEWMYERTGKTYYDSIAVDTALMTVNDVIAQGAMPVVFTDQIEASDSSWFADEKRAEDIARGFQKICEEVGMAMPAGESAALRYVINPQPPVKSIAALSGCTTGIIAPKARLITGKDLRPGDHIIAAASSGIHSNGISLAIRTALALPDQFLTRLPGGKTLGEAILTPTRSYVALIEALLEADIQIHALLPATGDGLGKIAFDKRAFTYRVNTWFEVPEIFVFFREQGVEISDLLKTFNWGAGYYIFSPEDEVKKILDLGQKAGYQLMDIGTVEDGKRQVIFEPEKLTLQPPGA